MAKPSKPGYYASHPRKFAEHLLLQESKNPDNVKANQAKGNLLVQNEGFIIRATHTWLNSQPSYLHTSILQDARLAFLKAIENYDLSRDISIRTFARYHLMKVREKTFKKRKLYEELHEHYADEVAFYPNYNTIYRDIREIIREAISQLTVAEREVIEFRYYKGHTGREISTFRGCSEARISALTKSALRKLKITLVEKGVKPGFFDEN